MTATGQVPIGGRMLRADLHVHSCHSGFTSTLPLFRSRDSYSMPDEIYRAARSRGMDVVTITDHDSLEGSLRLRDQHPDAADILMGEEIECRLRPHAIRVHLGVLGLDERAHREVQSLRGDVREAAGFLRASGAALVLNHPFHFFRGEMRVREYVEALWPLVDAVEVRNGTMLPAHNDLSAALTRAWCASRKGVRRGEVGGSDAHVLAHVADCHTEAPGATPGDLVDALKQGRCRAAGFHGTAGRFAFEIYGVILNYWGGLIGLRSSGLTPGQRIGGAACSLVSLPFQWTPWLVSLAQKRGERRRVARWRRQGQTLSDLGAPVGGVEE